MWSEVKIAQSCPTLRPCALHSPWNSLSQNTGVGSTSPGDLPNPGIEPRSPALQADSLPAEPAGKKIYVNLDMELDMEKQTGSKSGKEYIKAVYCQPAYLTYMQSTSCEMPGWMKHKLESRLLGEISTTSGMQMTPRLWQKTKKN